MMHIIKTKHKLSLFFVIMVISTIAIGAESVATPSATNSMLKVIIALVIVLAVLAGIAWLLKQFNLQHGNQNTVAKIVGGVSVGSRERLIVVEVADRWLVVGVSPGQITSIANLDKSTPSIHHNLENTRQSLSNPFSQWLADAIKKPTKP